MNNIAINLLMAGQTAAQSGAEGAPATAGGGIMQTVLMFVPMALIFYFLIIRPQKKQQKEQGSMLENLKKDDKVQLSSGIIGTITKVKDDFFVVEIDKSNHTTIEVIKSAVSGKIEAK